MLLGQRGHYGKFPLAYLFLKEANYFPDVIVIHIYGIVKSLPARVYSREGGGEAGFCGAALRL